MKKQTGFTLVELIIVIVILGILAAYAVPKFMNADKQARISVVKGMYGSVRTASELVHALAIAKQVPVGDAVEIDNETMVKVGVGHYAVLADIQKAIADTNDFDITTSDNSTMFKLKGATDPESCSVTYRYDDSVVPPKITYLDTGC